MKKLFYLAVLVVAVSFSACGNMSKNKEEKSDQQYCQNDEIPQEILKLVEERESVLSDDIYKWYDGSMTFKGIDIESHDIVITAEFDEAKLPGGMTFKQACELSGMTEDFFAQSMKEKMFAPNDEEHMEAAAILRKYEYNIVFRLVGSISGDKMNCKIGYDEMPQ